MQSINIGLIEGLVIRNGEPVLDPPPRVVRNVKFGRDNKPRPESGVDDFALKAQVIDLFAHFDSIGNGTVRCLEVQNGLPFRMQIEEVPA
jgi:hypothetical protein